MAVVLLSRKHPLVVCLFFLGALGLGSCSSCKGKYQAEVEGVWIAQAEGTEKIPDGTNYPVKRGAIPKIPEGSKEVKLALARDLRWSTVKDLRDSLISSGANVHLLVADGRKVGAIKLQDELEGEAIRVYVSVGGKLCVAPPGSPEAKCVQRGDRLHVDRAFTRELVREAVKAYKLSDVSIDVPSDLEWADVVRAVDGARTCCFEKKVRVRLKN